jgi:hypothetical protein
LLFQGFSVFSTGIFRIWENNEKYTMERRPGSKSSKNRRIDATRWRDISAAGKGCGNGGERHKEAPAFRRVELKIHYRMAFVMDILAMA